MILYCTKYLLLTLAIVNASPHRIQPEHPKQTPTQNENNIINDITILEKMKGSTDDIETPVHRVCKFPPKSVLHDFSTFPFFEKCDKKVPTQLTPHTPDDDVLCMGLYEIGLRLCSFATKFSLSVTSIPSKPSDFNELLLHELRPSKSDSKLCSEFERLPSPQALEIESVEDWNILRMFKNNNQVCPHICFYINGDAKELCKLILWGNTLMVNTSNALSASNVEATAVKPIEEHIQQISGIGVDQSSRGRQNLPYLQQKDSSPIVSSADTASNSQNVNPKQSEAITANQKVDLDSHTTGSKHSAVANVPDAGSAQEAVQIDHPSASSAFEQELPSAEDEEAKTRKSIASKVENTKKLKIETALHESDVNKPEEVHEEMKTAKQVKTVKAITPVSSSLLPVTAPTISAPEVIVQDTASHPSIEATNQEIMGAEELSEFDDPNVEQSDDEDTQAEAIDQPVKADESVNGEAEYQKPREDINIKYVHERFEEPEDSHFFRYFMTMVVFCIFGYLLFHNKQKILALFLEGRSRRGNRRRPNTANYHKLDSNLEEAVSSPCNASVAHVIY